MSGLGGGGDAWAKNHDKILAHARDLKYDKVPGVTLPAADAPKEEWIPAMDAFNAWKAGEVAKEPSGQAWWQTYSASPAPESGGGESGGSRGGGGLLDLGDVTRGPYPLANQYFPLLTTEYIRPQAYDETAFGYIPDWIESGPFPGLLYQTGTEQYNEAFPMEQSILEYQPNIFGVGPVQYYGAPFGRLNVVPPEELFTEKEEDKNPLEERGDKSDDSSDPGQPPGVSIGDHPGIASSEVFGD